jgi:large subunit ribosomal protein L15
MKLNSIGPAPGSKKSRTRVGRGASAGQGKTCGRGVKGQRKVGFRSAMARRTAEVRLSELHKVAGGKIDLASLKAASLVPADSLHAKIVLSGEVKVACTVTGVGVTKGARAAIEAAGGKVVDAAAQA